MSKVKKKSKRVDRHRVWDRGRRGAQRFSQTWDDKTCNVYAYGFLAGYLAARRELTKKARRK